MLLVCANFSVGSTMTLPKGLTEVSKQDAWISLFFPIIYCIVIVLILFLLMRSMPGQNIFEISKNLCGKYLGTFLNIIFILYLFFDLVINIIVYADYFNSAILLRTPLEYIVLITIALLMYFGRGSIEETARIASLFFPILFIISCIEPVVLLNEIDITKLQPILSEGSKGPFRGGLLGIGSLGDVIAFGAFLGNIKNPRAFYVSMKTGILISGFILILNLFLIITVFGYTSASRIIFIGWFIVQQIHITDFLDRVDLFLISFWLPNLFIKFIILYLSILVGLASFTKKKSYIEFNGLLGCLVIMGSVLCFNNIADVINAYNFGMIPFTLSVQILFLGILLVALMFRKSHTAKFSDHWNYGRFIWVSLIVCAVAIYLSDLIKQDNGIYGVYLGIAFFIFFLLALFFSIREFSKLQMDSK
jgi:spore germination protein (amino acid permease)